MCPACYVPFIAAITTWLISFFGLEFTHAHELWISWVVSIILSIGIYYLAKFLWKKYKTCKIK